LDRPFVVIRCTWGRGIIVTDPAVGLHDLPKHVILTLVLFNNPIFEVSYPERWRDRPYETAATPLIGKVPSPTDVFLEDESVNARRTQRRLPLAGVFFISSYDPDKSSVSGVFLCKENADTCSTI
jgi:hypothetical protein